MRAWGTSSICTSIVRLESNSSPPNSVEAFLSGALCTPFCLSSRYARNSDTLCNLRAPEEDDGAQQPEGARAD